MRRAAVFLVLLLAGPSAWALDPVHTDQRHLSPPPTIPRPKRPPAEAHMTQPAEPVILVVKDTPWSGFGKPDPVLSSACKLGRFLPLGTPFRTLLTGKSGQAMLETVPHYRSDLLRDLDKHARRGETYHFRNPGWGDCEVHFEGPEAPRQLDDRGTAAPPMDREARRQKALETWGRRKEER